MFSPHLFTHKFDIDDLIAAMLAGEGSYLETVTGKLSPTPPQADEKHVFHIEPLPKSWLLGLETHDDYFRLTFEEQTELKQLIHSSSSNPLILLSALLPLVRGPTTLGGWLRERVKEEALQWLADNNLIPPSMRHINGVPRARLKPQAEATPTQVKKVNIEPA
jgi:hypothetical protein